MLRERLVNLFAADSRIQDLTPFSSQAVIDRTWLLQPTKSAACDAETAQLRFLLDQYLKILLGGTVSFRCRWVLQNKLCRNRNTTTRNKAQQNHVVA